MIDIRNVSFVIITRNESFGVDKCIQALKRYSYEDCQFIFVDSDSSDDTLKIIEENTISLPDVKIIKCSGYLNAAVGRHVGFREVENENVFFLDGDTEINLSFINRALELFHEKSDILAVCGGLDEIGYNESFAEKLYRRPRKPLAKEVPVYNHVGTIFARTEYVRNIGSWDIRLKASEDRDFIARLWKYGKVVGIDEFIGVHHTKPYHLSYKKKLWNRHYMCLGLVLRKNIFNKVQLIDIVKTDPAPFFGYLVYITAILAFALHDIFKLDLIVCLVPSCLLFMIDFLIGVRKPKELVYRLVNRYIRPFHIFLGIFLPLKASLNNVKVEYVKR